MHQKQPPPKVAFSRTGLVASALASPAGFSPSVLAGSDGSSADVASDFSPAFGSAALGAPLRRGWLAPERLWADASRASPRTRKAASNGARGRRVMVELLDGRRLGEGEPRG